jgi:hypothetical protein
MWIAHLGQASSLQGHFGVNGGVLAGNDWGIGSGWQQSKQNSTLLAVTRQWARMQCRYLCRVEATLLHPYCMLELWLLPAGLGLIFLQVLLWSLSPRSSACLVREPFSSQASTPQASAHFQSQVPLAIGPDVQHTFSAFWL